MTKYFIILITIMVLVLPTTTEAQTLEGIKSEFKNVINRLDRILVDLRQNWTEYEEAAQELKQKQKLAETEDLNKDLILELKEQLALNYNQATSSLDLIITKQTDSELMGKFKFTGIFETENYLHAIKLAESWWPIYMGSKMINCSLADNFNLSFEVTAECLDADGNTMVRTKETVASTTVNKLIIKDFDAYQILLALPLGWSEKNNDSELKTKDLVLIKETEPEKTITITAVSSNSIVDNDAKFGSMTYYWESDGTVKMLPRLSEMTGEVIDGSKIEPVALLSVSKKPVYLGTSRFKTYIIAPKPGEFLKLNLAGGTGETTELDQVLKNLRLNLSPTL